MSKIGINKYPLYIGNYVGRKDVYGFHGIIDEVRIYDVALSKEEVSQLFTSECKKFGKYKPYSTLTQINIDGKLDETKWREMKWEEGEFWALDKPGEKPDAQTRFILLQLNIYILERKWKR